MTSRVTSRGLCVCFYTVHTCRRCEWHLLYPPPRCTAATAAPATLLWYFLRHLVVFKYARVHLFAISRCRHVRWLWRVWFICVCEGSSLCRHALAEALLVELGLGSSVSAAPPGSPTTSLSLSLSLSCSIQWPLMYTVHHIFQPARMNEEFQFFLNHSFVPS